MEVEAVDKMGVVMAKYADEWIASEAAMLQEEGSVDVCPARAAVLCRLGGVSVRG